MPSEPAKLLSLPNMPSTNSCRSVENMSEYEGEGDGEALGKGQRVAGSRLITSEWRGLTL